MRTKKTISKKLLGKTFVLFMFFSGFFYMGNAQNKGESSSPKDPTKPDVQIKVNRELDNNGNVIRYDSTYTWSWSSDGSQPVPSDFFNDTNQTGFFQPFDNHSFFEDDYFDPFGFTNDSMFNRHFMNPDMNMLHKQMQEMLQQQQKMMQEFFGQPPALSVPEQNNNNEQNDQKKAPAKKTSGGIDI